MIILDKTVISPTEPPWTSVLWIRPVEGGVGFYTFMNGRWEPLRVMNSKGSTSPEDDQPYDLDGIGANKLSQLEDVSFDSLSEGQVLKFNGTSWENGEDSGGGQPGPNSVGTEELKDGAVEMQDLHEDVKGKIQKIYDQDDETLHMDYEEADVNNSNH